MNNINYDDGVEATIAEHKKNLCEELAELIKLSDGDTESIIENASIIEELGHFLEELRTEWKDECRARITYNSNLNHYEIVRCKQSYKELYNAYTEQHALSARMYFAILKLAMGRADATSQEVAKYANETTYKQALLALGEIKED